MHMQEDKTIGRGLDVREGQEVAKGSGRRA